MTKISDILSSPLAVPVSFFPNVWSKEPSDSITLAAYMDGVKSGQWSDAVAECRKALAKGDERGYTQVKRKLGAVTISCRMASRAEGADVRVIQHSGWLQADFDIADNAHLGTTEAAIGMRLALAADPHIGAVFCGPSGRGLKAIVRIDGARHRESALSAARYFLDRYSLKTDPACKDVERLCFVSVDPEAWWTSAEPAALPVTDIRDEPPAGITSPQESEWLAEDVREVLAVIPPPIDDYDLWLRLSSAVFNTLPFEAAVEVLREWAPEQEVGEYAKKWKSRLKQISIRTVIFEAQKHGFDAAAAARRKRWMGRLVFSGGVQRGATGHAELLDVKAEQLAQVEACVEVYNFFEQEQDGDAMMFMRFKGDDWRYIVEKKTWACWDASARIWREDGTRTIRYTFGRLVAEEYLKLAEVQKEAIRKEGGGPKDKGWEMVKTLETRAKMLRRRGWRDDGLNHLEPMLAIHASQFDSRPNLLALASHVVDFDACCVRGPERGDMLSVASPAIFVKDAACPRFDAFLRTVFADDEDLIAYWWRVIGYCLTGYVNHDAMFFCYGKGANGKSLMFDALKLLMGTSLMMRLDITVLLGGMEGNPAVDYKKASLQGKRLVVTDELPEGKKLNESLVKQLVGGDSITARRPYQDPYEFQPTHKLFVVGNHKPKITGTDHGIWRRLHLIPFTVTIPLEKQRPRHVMLEEFKGEVSGMLWRAILGWIDLQGRGRLDPPAAVLDATTEYRAEEDQLGNFLSECTVEASQSTSVSAKALFQAYSNWCEEQDEWKVAKTQRSFNSKLVEAGVRVEVDRERFKHVPGLRLRKDVQGSSDFL